MDQSKLASPLRRSPRLLAANSALPAPIDIGESAVKKVKKNKNKFKTDAADAEVQKKSEKKTKKNKTKQTSADEEAESSKKRKTSDEEVNEEVVDAPKKKKKKSKKTTAETEETTETPAVEESSEKKATSKKDKKKKSSKKEQSSSGDVEMGFLASAQEDVSEAERERRRDELKVTVDGVGADDFPPLISFDALKLGSQFNRSQIMKACANFQRPSPVQAQCWPIVVSGRDTIGIASTGSGKTLAFGIPALIHVLGNKRQGTAAAKGATVLCLSPTRELATQIAEVLTGAYEPSGVGCVCIYGGVPKHSQRAALKTAEVVVATPGRLLDLMDEGSCVVENATFVVLDEADRMLDMGFEKDVRRILSTVPKQRQTVMFSATWPQAIQSLAAEFLINPIRVTVGSTDLAAAHTVTQIVEVVEQKDKESILHNLLSKYHTGKNRVLVFCLYKKEAARIEQFLARKQWNPVAIHGDMSQTDRNRAFAEFKSGVKPLLVATDVAARGLDIPNVEFVINLTFPLTIEDYVHRIGRTGRAGKTGTAHTLFTMLDKQHSGALINILREANQNVPEALLKFGTGVKRKEHKLYGAHFKAGASDAPMPESTRIVFGQDSDSD